MDTLSEISLPWPLDREAWKPIPGWSTYEVSCYGNIRSQHHGLRRTFLRRDGYRTIALYREGERTTFRVHRIVLLAFMGDPADAADHGRHLNGCRDDNSINNLCWGTAADNVLDQRRDGTMVRGERHGSAKVDEGAVLGIRQMHASGLPQREIARRAGLSRRHIRNILKGIRWAHVA